MKGNQSALIVAVLLTLGLFSLAGAVVWLGLRQNSALPTPPDIQPPTKNVAKSQGLDAVDLKSDRNVSYIQLREYLRAKNWSEADRETYLRLLDASGPGAQATGMTPQAEMITFSCTDLSTVDQLWSASTNAQQGFTVQISILKAFGSDYRKLYNAVGWQQLPPSNTWAFERRYNTQNHRVEFVPGKIPNYTNPVPGHLPTVEVGYNLDVAFSAALKRCGF